MSDGNDFYEKVGTAVGNNRGEGASPVAGRVPESELNKHIDAITQNGIITVRRWAQSDDIFWPASETVDKLEPAFYRFDQVLNIGVVLRRSTVSTDGLIHLPDTVGEKVLGEFNKFWDLRDKFTERGFLHKRGILLHGPAGSGKTSSLMLMAHEIIEKQKGIVCQIEEPTTAAIGLAHIRKIEPHRPVIALLEDLDALVARWGESYFLALLDGETQVDRIVYVATCNYPERLDRRFVDRPSRFDTVEYIGMPSPAARRIYLSTKETSLKGNELEEWVDKTEGFSVAHLRELIILVKCFDRDLSSSIERLEKMRFLPSSEKSPDKSPVGFGVLGKVKTKQQVRDEDSDNFLNTKF